MFNEVYIPAQLPLLVLIGIMTSIFYGIKLTKYKRKETKAASRIMVVANTIFVVMILSSLAHEYWQWETMVSNTTMMKIVLVLLGGFGLYLNIMYFRAEVNYKEKRGNQRIKDDPDESFKEVKKVEKQAKSGKGEVTAVLGESRQREGYPVILKGDDFFVHSLIVGSTGSGKSASILEPLAYQLLLQKKKGKKLGLTVVEPKRDFALQVKEYCDEMEIPYLFIDPLSDETNTFNPMEGEINQVAEATVVVLQGLFGKQEAFFASVQELSARNVTKLLKELNGDDLDIIDVMNTLRDPDDLKRKVEELKARDGMTDLVQFFEHELLGTHAEKYRQFVIGLRSQLENITSNDLLRRIMTGKSDLDINKHFEEGGVLIVNTELGKLGKSGNIFGQFLIMHLQNGTFNRPGPAKDRIPHYMIIDEYSLYINPEIERFLSVARSYRVAGIFATQSLGQLEVESGNVSGKAMRQAIMTNCRNQIVFGGVSSDDARQFAEEFGKDKVVMRQATYKHKIFMPVLFPDSYRDTETEEYRFDPTDIMTELKKFTFIHKLMYDSQIQRPEIAQGVLVPRNWKKLREWEDKSFSGRLKKLTTALLTKGVEKVKEFKKEEESGVRISKEDKVEKPRRESIGLERQESVSQNEEFETKHVSYSEESDTEHIKLAAAQEEMYDESHLPPEPPEPEQETFVTPIPEQIEVVHAIEEQPNEEVEVNETSFKQQESVKPQEVEEVEAEKEDTKQKEYVPQATVDDGFWD